MKLANYLSQQVAREALMTSDFKRYYLGPIVISLLLFFGEAGVRLYSFPVTLAIPYAVLSLTVYRWSGLRSALVSALLISLYPVLLRYDWYGPWGSVIIAIGAFGIAGPSGLLKKALREQAAEAERERLRAEENQAKADFVDSLNGNILFLKEINQDMIKFANALPVLSEEDAIAEANRLQNRMADLAQRAIGWRELAEAKNIVKGVDSET